MLFTREKIKFIDNSAILYDFWSKFLGKKQYSVRMVRDSLRFLKVELYSVLTTYGLEVREVDDGGKSGIVLVRLEMKVQKNPSLHCKSQLSADFLAPGGQFDAKLSPRSTSSTMDLNRERGSFNDVVFSGSMDYDGKYFDLPENDALFISKYKQHIVNCDEDFPERESLFSFFSKYTISDKERKQMWKIRIGNSLRIDRELFETLKLRFKNDGIKPQVAKLIVDDLNRTLANYKNFSAGQIMYDGVQELLSLFQVYRPDIGYVQGMSFLIVFLYYYYEDFECFVLFCNMILTKKLMFSCYDFNIDSVSAGDRR